MLESNTPLHCTFAPGLSPSHHPTTYDAQDLHAQSLHMTLFVTISYGLCMKPTLHCNPGLHTGTCQDLTLSVLSSCIMPEGKHGSQDQEGQGGEEPHDVGAGQKSIVEGNPIAGHPS